MANKIKIKRGLSSDLSQLTLEPGELGVALDTQKLYVGDGSGVVKPIATDPGKNGVHVGTTEPTDTDVQIWVNPDAEVAHVPQHYTGTGEPPASLGQDGDLYIKI